MKIDVLIDKEELKKLIIKRLEDLIDTEIKPEDVRIEVKSQQNYKSEWESADFRATVTKVSK